ncbi:MAG: TIGR00266 family protein [Peptoclostridium sp.]|uniref:TIGR00266 family protein n=1 Tax=Peptoclostridium sp. TaxID=1904860 RepID=UPI00139DBD56|nr:TIGR00266 family protein [Peptoclostridium sp.]MZQ75356.1 TIGR00266 family protein [Peptoclostridium sp.]
MQRAHEIDYKLYGDDLQLVEIELDPGESVIAEAGAMLYMENGIQMEAVFGDASGKGEGAGLMGKLLGAGKRVIMGESLFMTLFTNKESQKQKVSFAAPYPGKIVPFDLNVYGGRIICQKDAFLCAARGISVQMEFQKKIGVGLFGGEGFIMERLEGDGLAFLHAGGTIIEKELSQGEVLKVDTGCLVAFTSEVDYDIQFMGDIKSAIFGGEGIVLATLKGPGKVWLQSLPFSRLADRMISASRHMGGGGASKDEGSLLGGLGRLLDGD